MHYTALTATAAAAASSVVVSKKHQREKYSLHLHDLRAMKSFSLFVRAPPVGRIEELPFRLDADKTAFEDAKAAPTAPACEDELPPGAPDPPEDIRNPPPAPPLEVDDATTTLCTDSAPTPRCTLKFVLRLAFRRSLCNSSASASDSVAEFERELTLTLSVVAEADIGLGRTTRGPTGRGRVVPPGAPAPVRLGADGNTTSLPDDADRMFAWNCCAVCAFARAWFRLRIRTSDALCDTGAGSATASVLEARAAASPGEVEALSFSISLAARPREVPTRSGASSSGPRAQGCSFPSSDSDSNESASGDCSTDDGRPNGSPFE
eukprot:CAMPEP_0178986874 /NCGR_PEP_ID=MMETSP0795-20121207/2947_1 /TAXON_ID=88552 /ORGANISM="Amoebophrya sp., Strain Ameob2" /LENGTH=320 /DNA_ID=CAMNT_0020677985 /DNA_START=150 /DNA_END=1112 /DNA_ORIENTATION=-